MSFHELHNLRDTVSLIPALGFDARIDGATYEAAEAPDIHGRTPRSTENDLGSSQVFGLYVVAQVFVGPRSFVQVRR